MRRLELVAAGSVALLAALPPASATESTSAASTIDCAGDPLALQRAEPVVQHRDGPELHQYWRLADRPDLWKATVPELLPLERYRRRVRELLPDTSPLGLIRANREHNPWLEREHPAEAAINRLVLSGVGTHRPMNCLESHLLAYQAGRFPLYEQPTEIVALLLGSPADEASIKVYFAAGDSAVPPRPAHALEALEIELAAGWRFETVFHNHTFNHSPDRGLIPVAAPSWGDLQVSVALMERLGLASITVSDGFSTLELDVEQTRRLWSAAEAARGEAEGAEREPPSD